MLVVCFGDGLGNQMFQYAFYKALKYKYPDNNVFADICNFYGAYNNHNGYELKNIFGIDIPECDKRSAQFLADYMPASRHKILNRLYQIRKIIFGPKDTFVTQDDPTVYYEELFGLNRLKSYMFRGNWINEKYFDFIENDIVKDFKFPKHNSKLNIELLERINGRNSIAVHIRRGDYLETNMNKLDDGYYNCAINKMKEMVANPYFLFFSDEPEFIRKKFSEIHNLEMEVVDWNKGNESYRDMQLMSQCKHNIIANSTFSFWGAYLNCNDNKIVIAPKYAAHSYRNPFACDKWLMLTGEI